MLAIRSFRYVVNDRPVPGLPSRFQPGRSNHSPDRCFFLPWKIKSVDQLANISTNRANLPNEGVLLLILLSWGCMKPWILGETGDGGHLELVMTTKGFRPALSTAVSLIGRRQVFHGWNSSIEADSVPKPLVEISMDALSLLDLPIMLSA